MAGLQMLPLLHTIVTSDKITYPPLPLPQKYPKTISTSKPLCLWPYGIASGWRS